MNRTFKAAIAALVSAIVIGLAIAYVPGLRVKTALTFRRAANLVGLVDWDPVKEGRDAAQRGDFATAFERLRALAEQGDATAQNKLGMAYELGDDGIPQAYAVAVTCTERRPTKGMPGLRTILARCMRKAKVFRKTTRLR